MFRHNIKYIVLLLYLVPCCTEVWAQRHEILDSRIASLQVTAGDDWLHLPVIELTQQTPLLISFDDLTHVYHRYLYKIEHCEADWTPSEQLFSSDYCQGFAQDNTIDEIAQSINTIQPYTHYSLQIPNDKCRLKMSGNYLLTVYDGNDNDRPVLKVCFMVVEQLVGIGMEVVTNTDADINGRHQQVNLSLKYGGLTVTEPTTQLKTVVMQNGRWDNAVVNAKPQYVMDDGLQWLHNRSFIFNGGNEYRKFEMLDPSHPTMGLESIDWDGKRYNAHIWTDEPRFSYVYDEDANGAFVIRNSDNSEVDYTSEYIMVHFRLRSPLLPGDIYIAGAWTNDRLLPIYKMQWNDVDQLYEAALWLKQGYYNYQYVWRKTDGTLAPVPSEGNFYQTENEYTTLVYYRGLGDRSDRLVGYTRLKT